VFSRGFLGALDRSGMGDGFPVIATRSLVESSHGPGSGTSGEDAGGAVERASGEAAVRVALGRSVGGGTRTGCAALFGLAFLGAGLFFLVMMLRLAGDTVAEQRWPKVPATIVSSSHGAGGGEEHPYRFLVRYRYRFGGRWLTSSTYQNGYVGTDDFEPVQRLLLRYPPGAHVTCRVNPRNPADAVLRPRSPWMVLLVLFPLPFIAIGLAVLVGALRNTKAAAGSEPLGSDTPTRPGRGPVVLGAIFLIAGLGGMAAMLPWMLGPIRARTWTPVRARVISSGLRRHTSTDSDGHTSTTWKLDILYEYRFRGHTYRSNRYGFVGGSSSGYYGKRDMARRHPAGSRVTAWVNPSDPARAVIERGYTLSHLIFLVPLLFAGVGLLLLRKGRRARKVSRAPGLPAVDEAAGPLRLEPGAVRAKKLGAFLFFCLFWNGIVSVFVWQVVQGFRHGHPPWFLTVFLVPFVLVGLVLVGVVIHSLLALANPRITVTVLASRLRLGDSVRIAWSASGRVERLRRLRMVLEGQEKATYRRGTDVHTDTRTFRTIPIAELHESSGMRNGEAEIAIPADTMHTFKGQSNQILWHLKLEGDIPRWPDVSDEWELEILPLATGEV